MGGIRADLEDAFGHQASCPRIEVIPDGAEGLKRMFGGGCNENESSSNNNNSSLDMLIMMAGMTVSTDPQSNKNSDRAALGRTNCALFREYARALVEIEKSRHDDAGSSSVVVVVQSNPVELGVEIFARALLTTDKGAASRVVGAGGWSDSLRFRNELAQDLGVHRTQVSAVMLGQHGDHLVPVWSQIHVRGRDAAEVMDYITQCRQGRTALLDLPQEISTHKAHMKRLVVEGRVEDAYRYVQALPPDLRAAVQPFFTHFTAGRTTEMATAHAVVDLVEALVQGTQQVMPCQVLIDRRWVQEELLAFDGNGPTQDASLCAGEAKEVVLSVPVIVSPTGWDRMHKIGLADDEREALWQAAEAIRVANAALLQSD